MVNKIEPTRKTLKYTIDGRRAYGRELRLSPKRRRPKDGESAAVWMRGDAAFDTPEMKAARAALRHEPKVVAVLDKWWDATDLDGSGAVGGRRLYRRVG